MAIPYFKTYTNREFQPGKELPIISEGLNSVRSYGFELHFPEFPVVTSVGTAKDLTLAVKQVGGIGAMVQEIEAHRVNDVTYYPGKRKLDPMTVTFDDLMNPRIAILLWEWYKSIDNPMTGEQTESLNISGGNKSGFKAKRVELVHLDNKMQPLKVTELYGVFPLSWKEAEFKYEDNTFHTIEMQLRYDFLQHKQTSPLTG